MIEPGAKNFFTRLLWLLFLLGALTLMYQIWKLTIRDLSAAEGLFAAFASETDISRPMSIAHGVAIKNQYFLYPWLCSAIQKYTAADMVSILRYVNLFFVVCTALLIAAAAGLTRDFKAGIVGAAMFCANGYVFMHTLHAGSLMMSLCFLFAAQICWIYFGFSKGHWNFAWISGLFMVSLGFLAGGIRIPIYFFLPLLFLHRPLKLSPKLNKKGFVFGMIILGLGFLLWAAPFLLHVRDFSWDYIPHDYRGMSNFLLNILLSPLYLMLLFLPWPLIMWFPFCAAIRPLDKTPIFSHYFRVLFTANLILTLFNPFSTMDDFMFTVPPLVLLCALSYDTAVRRYSVEMRKLATLCGYITALLAAALIIYCFCPYEDLIKYVNFLPLGNGKELIFSAILGFLVLSVWIYHYRKQGQLWLIMLLTGSALGIFAQLTFIPSYNADRSRSSLGRAVYEAIEKDNAAPHATIYKIDILDLYSEGHYMKKNIRKINNLENIDKKEPVIYLLTTDFPQYPERTWKNLFETTYRGRKLFLYRGDIAKRKELINRRNLLRASSGDEK